MNVRRRSFSIGAAVALLGLATAAAPSSRVIRIVAKRFDFTPAHLTLKKGEPVILELTTRDVVMGFNLPDFNLRGDIVPDQVTRLPFVPHKTGTFTFLCDIFCGSGHEAMHGTMTVV